MAKKKWRANSKVAWDDRTPFQRWGWPVLAVIIVASVATIAWNRYSNAQYKYGDNGYQEGRAMTNCIQDRTRHTTDEALTADAATACVQQDDDAEAHN